MISRRVCAALLSLMSIATAASAAGGRWSLSPAVGSAHQNFTSSGFLISLDVAFEVQPFLDLGVRGGYFDPGGCCAGESTDTHYGVLFARLHRPDGAWQPFVEAGGGDYVVQNDTEPGWFMRCAASRPSTSWSGNTAVFATELHAARIIAQWMSWASAPR